MLSIQQVILDLSTPALAVGTGLFYFRRLDRFNKLLFFQTLIYLLIDALAARQGNNGWAFNIITVTEMGLILLAVSSLFDSPGLRYTLLAAYIIFIMVFLADMIFLGPMTFARDACITENLLLIGILLYVLYTEFMGRRRGSVIAACTGMVLYFACFTPYLGIMFYLQDKDAALNQQLFRYIVVVLQAVRYFLVAFAFAWQAFEERKRKELTRLKN